MALPDLTIDRAYLITAWLASALWGIFTIIFLFWLVSTIRGRARRPVNYISTVAVCCMYILATVQLSFVFQRIIYAFLVAVNDPEAIGSPGAQLYLSDAGQPLNRDEYAIYVTLLVIADLALIWRCYVVWGRKAWVTVLPLSFVIGTAVAGYGVIIQLFVPGTHTLTTMGMFTLTLTLSMAVNLIVSALTAGRIWYMASRIATIPALKSSSNSYHQIMILVLESGLVMTVGKTLEFTLFLVNSNAFWIVMNSMPQIMGICPTFIILSVYTGFVTPPMPMGTCDGFTSGGSAELTLVPFPVRQDTMGGPKWDVERQGEV